MHLGRRLPVASCGLPRDGAGLPEFPLFGLAPRGVYRAAGVATDTGGLLPHRSTLTVQRPRTTAFTNGGIVSVALAWGFPHWALPSTRPVESRLSSTVSTEVLGSGSPASWIGMSFAYRWLSCCGGGLLALTNAM